MQQIEEIWVQSLCSVLDCQVKTLVGSTSGPKAPEELRQLSPDEIPNLQKIRISFSLLLDMEMDLRNAFDLNQNDQGFYSAAFFNFLLRGRKVNTYT